MSTPKTALTYGRDNLSVPLGDRMKVIAQVCSGCFWPDEKRGARWITKKSQRTIPLVALEEKMGIPALEIAGSDAPLSMDLVSLHQETDENEDKDEGEDDHHEEPCVLSEEEEEVPGTSRDKIEDKEMEAAEVAGAGIVEKGSKAPCRFADTSVMYKHCTRDMYHYGSNREGDKTVFGKQLFPHYQQVGDVPVFPWPQGGTCLGTD